MIFYILLISYASFAVFLGIGFKRTRITKKGNTVSATVLVPFRNEGKEVVETAKAILSAVERDSRIKQVLYLNDHSTDKGAVLLSEYIESKAQDVASVVHVPGQGKKQALEHGVQLAATDVVLTVDADVYPQTGWPSQILDRFEDDSVQMVCGSVHVTSGNGLLSKLEAIDVLSLVGSAKALIGNHWAVMCNGANMAYRKSAFHKVDGYSGNDQLQSGDDVFLLHKMMKQFPNGVTTPEQSKTSGVETAPQNSLVALYQQRIRWAGKSTSYKNFQSIFTSILIAILCLSIVVGFLASIFWGEWLPAVLTLYLGKAIVDTLLLAFYSRKYQRNLPVSLMFLQGLIYPFYTTAIAVSAPLVKFTWKDR